MRVSIDSRGKTKTNTLATECAFDSAGSSPRVPHLRLIHVFIPREHGNMGGKAGRACGPGCILEDFKSNSHKGPQGEVVTWVRAMGGGWGTSEIMHQEVG